MKSESEGARNLWTPESDRPVALEKGRRRGQARHGCQEKAGPRRQRRRQAGAVGMGGRDTMDGLAEGVSGISSMGDAAVMAARKGCRLDICPMGGAFFTARRQRGFLRTRCLGVIGCMAQE